MFDSNQCDCVRDVEMNWREDFPRVKLFEKVAEMSLSRDDEVEVPLEVVVESDVMIIWKG